MALTSYTESYEHKKKTVTIFIHLTAAYNKVWRDGLKYKLANIIKCKTLRLLYTITGTRYYNVLLRGNKNKTSKSKKGVPQGSVLSPTLFNIHISVMQAISWKFGCSVTSIFHLNNKHGNQTLNIQIDGRHLQLEP